MGPKSAASAKPGAASDKGNGASNGGKSDAFRQKRAKMYAARNIPAQPADSALKDGELDLPAFIAAHEFEIRSLEQSMATSKAVGASRAFQQVPRSLRRRTASHNAKRVPRRLRLRARREMVEDNTPTVESRKRKATTTRARIRAETAKRLGILAARQRKRRQKKAEIARKEGKEVTSGAQVAVVRPPRPTIRRNQLNEPPKPAAKFRKRQINKTWLPTHKWHAKRARMTEPKNPLWRFAIPLTPTEKIYRPTHRAQGEKGTMLWDMSYMSTIGLYGNTTGIERVLKRVGITADSCWSGKGRKWRSGTRAWSGSLTKDNGDYRRMMCPATVLWNPETTISEIEEQTQSKQRQVYLRVGPAAFLEVFTELLRLTRMEKPRLYLEDLRFEIGSVELTGPASTEALLDVLTPYPVKDASKNRHADLFKSLDGLTNPASLPANAILGLAIQDPRLRYPPRKMELSNESGADTKLLETLASWPSEEHLQPYGLFDRDARHRASCLPTQKSVSRRKGAIAPGAFLKAAKLDPPIPIILIASRSPASMQAQGTWTLLMPWKCVLPLWYSLVHCPLISGMNPRFGGLDETMQVAFERGLPWFPTDFVGTDAGANWELEQRQKRKRAWERRPKSKRTEWATLDLGAGRKGEIGDGLACDFELVFGLQQSQHNEAQDVGEPMEVDAQQPAAKPRKEKTLPLHLLNIVSRTIFSNTAGGALIAPPNAVVNVRIALLARGAVTTCARIYRLPVATAATGPMSSDAEVPATIPPPVTKQPSLPHDLRAQWLAQVPGASTTPASKRPSASQATDMETRKRLLAQELTSAPAPYPSTAGNQRDVGGHPLVPDAGDLIGFVTTGSYCLRDGRAAAIGSIAAERVMDDVRAGPEGRLCIVRNAGENVGWIARWEAI